MNSYRLRALLVCALLLSGAAFGHWMRPHTYWADSQAKVDLDKIFPAAFGNWRVDDQQPVMIISPDVQAMLDKLYNQVLTRTYVDGSGNRIMVSVAYGGDQSDGTRAHRPDVCYPAQGFEILSNVNGSIPVTGRELPVRHMVAKLGSRVEPVTFWFTVGDYVALSAQDQKMMQMRYGLRGIIADGMLVRVSSISNDTSAAYALQNRFVQDLRNAFDPAWLPRVFGISAGSR
ncbi:EpsI family protein [Paucibacter sp. R3-3]|uniref:EpsI family protein n=1 Tax=Roseateles agri TaxID=3098619 RepID=A0ABU5DC73_9BURK|nr:exosortase-associated protein EpsI, B-type [Paucibacter sp. R3-3]MDY0743860.1 EpsI family protein [Paucibacter sp. R3-3]